MYDYTMFGEGATVSSARPPTHAVAEHTSVASRLSDSNAPGAGGAKYARCPLPTRRARPDPQAIVPSAWKAIHATREGSWHAGQVRAGLPHIERWRLTSNTHTQHDSIPGRPAMIPPFFPSGAGSAGAAPVPPPPGLPEKEVGGNECENECATRDGRGRDASLPIAMVSV